MTLLEFLWSEGPTSLSKKFKTISRDYINNWKHQKAKPNLKCVIEIAECLPEHFTIEGLVRELATWK